MEHYKHEHKVRGGCPADWVWIVPPTSGALVPTFHQEMLNYKLSPSFEYQDPIFKEFFKKKKITLNAVAKAAYFCFTLYHKRYKLRKEMLVFYGTMTGTAKTFATKFAGCLKLQFQVKLLPLDDTTFGVIENKMSSMYKPLLLKFKFTEMSLFVLGQTAVFIITSTFGDGDAPDHAVVFKNDMRQAVVDSKVSLDGMPYSVLALGSTAYEQFCAFGNECDFSLEALGGSRLVPLVKADARHGQEKAFDDWAKASYRQLCHKFSMELDDQVKETWPFAQLKAKLTFGKRLKLKPEMKGDLL